MRKFIYDLTLNLFSDLMKKGISPLVASVLLIAITMAVAAILASWVSGYTRTTLATLPTCIGGSLSYVSADYPKWDIDHIVAVIEAQAVSLGNFKFEVIFNNDTSSRYSDTQVLGLPPGASGTVISETIGGSSTDIKKVRVISNCSNVQTDWSTLKT